MISNAPPPVRLSVDDPDFDPQVGGSVVIKVDGRLIEDAVSYDCEAGEIVRASRDDAGNLQINEDGDEILLETLRGNVTVAWREVAP